jgi:hypothetical protein
MPLASSFIAFILLLGFHRMHLGLECVHGFSSEFIGPYS